MGDTEVRHGVTADDGATVEARAARKPWTTPRVVVGEVADATRKFFSPEASGTSVHALS